MVAQLLRHDIAKFSAGQKNMYYVKRLEVVEDQISRCDDVADKTKNLINLILGIASLQESRAANRSAGSMRRVTMLTFFYLPLTLASVCHSERVITTCSDQSVEYPGHERYSNNRGGPP